jgi:hypothetical protein
MLTWRMAWQRERENTDSCHLFLTYNFVASRGGRVGELGRSFGGAGSPLGISTRSKTRKHIGEAMNRDEFLVHLQTQSAAFAKAVATSEGDWIIKGFIDIYQQIYTASVDTKIVLLC